MNQRHLAVRIAVVVGLIALLGAMLVSLLFYWRIQGSEVAAARQTTLQLAQTVQHTASIAAYLDNREIADELLRGLESNEILAGVSLTSLTGLHSVLGSASAGTIDNQAVRLTLMSPFTPGTPVGELILFPRQSLIESRARAVALDNAVLLGGYTLMIALLVMAAIQWLFVPPLRRMAAQLHHLQPGGAERLRLARRNRHDEIGQLASDINALLDLVRDKLEAERALRRQVREQAAARAHAQAQFLAHMSHEIRTPMNGIIGLAELALRRPLDEDTREYLDNLHQSALNLLAILNDILDQSKIESGQLHLEQAVFDQQALLDKQRALFEPVAQTKGLKFRVATDPAAPRWLVGDALRLGQILANLLSNALKFTERGEVALRVECLEQSGDRARLRWTVTDTGIGMDPATQARLFQPFTQGDDSIARRFGGTGLGLSISRHLVELMNGRLELNSAPEHGSCFALELSLATARAPAVAPAPTQPDTPLAAGARVLVADDQPINQWVVGDMLRLLGVDVDLANNGREALERLASTDYDAVLMDIQMPDMDGLSATRALRDNPAWADLPVIALTAGVTPAERERISAAGMSDLLPKPVTLTALRAALLRWLGDGREMGEDASLSRLDAPTNGDGALQLPGFNLQPLRQVAGDDRQVIERLVQFAETVRNDANTIATDLDRGAREQAASTLHRLKGLAGTMGALALHGAAAELEQALASGTDSLAALDKLRRAHAEALARIDAVPAPDPPQSSMTPARPEVAWALARELQTHLMEGLFVPPDLLTKLEAALPDEERPLLQDLKRHLRQFDYSAAKRLIESLRACDGPRFQRDQSS